MKITKTIATSIAAVTLLATSALAADIVTKAPKKVEAAPASCFDLAVGAGLQSDYNFRGISQSDRGPSVYGYVEPRCNLTKDIQAYVGLWGWSTKLPTQPTGEFDVYGGIRITIDKFAFDFGGIYYWYPREIQQFTNFPLGNVVTPAAVPGFVPLTVRDTDFWEVYGKATYTLNDQFSFGGSVFYSPSVLNSGADGTYVAGTAKYVLPTVLPAGIGWFLSADVGHWFLGTTDSFYGVLPGFAGGIPFKSYTNWDVGLAFTWKQFTLDLRYFDTDLNKGDCNAFTSAQNARFDGSFTSINPSGMGTNWCGATFIAKLSVDLTKDNLK